MRLSRLSVGEGPSLPGLSFTVELGIYPPNFGGVRVEEKTAVTQDGVDALTAHPRGPRSSWPSPDVLLGEPGKATKTGTFYEISRAASLSRPTSLRETTCRRMP